MTTTTKVFIGLGALWLLARPRATGATVPATGLRLVARDGSVVSPQPAGVTWRNDPPVTPTFSGGESGSGTSPLNSIVTSLLGLFVRPTRSGPNASAPPDTLIPASPYSAGVAPNDQDPGVPGTYIDPNQSLPDMVTLANPNLILVPTLGYGDVFWTGDPSTMIAGS